jgi:hypothetical protein
MKSAGKWKRLLGASLQGGEGVSVELKCCSCLAYISLIQGNGRIMPILRLWHYLDFGLRSLLLGDLFPRVSFSLITAKQASPQTDWVAVLGVKSFLQIGQTLRNKGIKGLDRKLDSLSRAGFAGQPIRRIAHQQLSLDCRMQPT